jgi:hypothetical protein
MTPHWGTGPRVKNAQKTTLNVNGKPHTFPSKAEAARYLQLKCLQKAGIVKEIELQPKFILRPAYWKCCHDVISNPASKGICHFCGKKMKKIPAWTYRADFRITWADGTQTIEDVKGYETEMFREKRRQFEYLFPDLTLDVVRV